MRFRVHLRTQRWFRKSTWNKYIKPHLFTDSSKLHFGSSFCRCFPLHYTSFFFIHYVLCSVNPIFLSSVLYFCLSPLIFLSFLCITLGHAWSGCHFRSLLLPSLLIAAFLLSVYIFAASLTSSFVFIFTSFSSSHLQVVPCVHKMFRCRLSMRQLT